MRQRAYLLLILIFTLSACGALGITQAPVSAQDKLMTAYASLTGTYKTIADMANRHVINKADGQAYIKRADEAKAYLDLAEANIKTKDESGAQQAIAAAIALLGELANHFPVQK